MLFSQRKGIKPGIKNLQREEMDTDLRNGLWNVLFMNLYSQSSHSSVVYSNLKDLLTEYWHSFFKLPIDSLPHEVEYAIKFLRKYFFECNYNEVYDFIEFTYLNLSAYEWSNCTVDINSILERENSAYRFVGGNFTDITDENEIESVESALSRANIFSGARSHLEAAVKLMSDRKSPDFRNSIKESISAVESICQIIAGDRKATLGEALKLLEKRFSLHGALKASFSSLYGYTSDADGIRHAMIDESNVTFSDAKYMLVTCSAFVNYLVGKIAEQGLSLPIKN